MEDKEAFLKRWSRLKQDAAKEQITKANAKSEPKAQDVAKSKLPPIEKLDFNSDFSGYMDSKIEESLRRTALKKLFDDPHFHFENMDKLDIYIDDYSIADPIPPDMLARLMESSPQLFPPKKEAPSRAARDQQHRPEIGSETGAEKLEHKVENSNKQPMQEQSTLVEQTGTLKKDNTDSN